MDTRYVAKVPSGHGFVDSGFAENIFLRDKSCTLISITPKHSVATYLDADGKSTTDYTNVKAVLDDALNGYVKAKGNMQRPNVSGTTGCAAYRALLLSLRSVAAAPVTCVVADCTMPFAIEIAEELGIPALAFGPFSACSHLALLAVPKLVEQGQIPSRADDPVSGVLGMEGFLRPRDLPRGHTGGTATEQGHVDPMLLKYAEVIARSCKKARALILNTAASMERSAVVHIAPRTRDVFTIGPLHARSTSAAGASLWREDNGCMAWLDGHEDRSVVYVSLGSLAVISQDQFTEFLSGLTVTGYAFLFVLRPGMV
ncbi:hypothetical protein QYE76_040526 [Lolium multiflorum]|uniref:Uncharacterized protein n=1 Tax=Lolium multiflorum TaxID=4521 RepID=A0AAD8TCY1_LOLMU|nr:hypothetical protein QYE76_040526 [Lolium multiflorum]